MALAPGATEPRSHGAGAYQGGGVGRAVVREVVDHARQLPGIAAISITSATFMERAHSLYESLGFQRAPERDWYVARRRQTALVPHQAKRYDAGGEVLVSHVEG